MLWDSTLPIRVQRLCEAMLLCLYYYRFFSFPKLFFKSFLWFLHSEYNINWCVFFLSLLFVPLCVFFSWLLATILAECSDIITLNIYADLFFFSFPPGFPILCIIPFHNVPQFLDSLCYFLSFLICMLIGEDSIYLSLVLLVLSLSVLNLHMSPYKAFFIFDWCIFSISSISF